MVTILDYGMGNIGSLQNMIRKVGGVSDVAIFEEQILNASKLLLPGVGAFDNAMSRLAELGWVDPLNKKVLEERTPILCICLGMQLITKRSEEGGLEGLGWIDAKTVRLSENKHELKVPHTGWNFVNKKKESKLLKSMYDDARFYFVHSYHVKCEDNNDVLATTQYGIEFTSAIEHGNIYATQFHPEKSHKYGMRLIQNFLEL